jgi:hypothetical protein
MMATKTIELRGERSTPEEQVIGGTQFDWAVIAVCSWLLGGVYLDAWAHNHIPLETFFTPWHAVLYSGLLAVVVFLVGTFIRNRLLRGYSTLQAVPAGYGLSLLGAILFIFGGIGDMLWHILFGIELNIEAALSPTHLALSVFLALIVAGPFRAAWHRSNAHAELDFVTLLPILISLTFTLSAITLISQFANPFVFTWPSESQQIAFGNQALGVVSIVLQTVILMGLVLLTIGRWTLPFGSLTLVFTLNMLFLSFMQDHYIMILVAVITGLTADILIWRLKPSTTRPTEFRLFAFLVPTVYYLLYFLALLLTTGVNWSIHLWLGSTVVAGITGCLLTYLLVPPALPVEAQ